MDPGRPHRSRCDGGVVMSYQDINARFRPLTAWPGERTRRPVASRFSAKWGDTLALLKRELRHLDARNLVLQIDVTERDIRQDGYPRANARPSSPGVVINFDSKYGPLRYFADYYNDWQDNVRAIAVTLENLRAIDRHHVLKRGEQYTGSKALPASTAPAMTAEQAAQLLAGYGTYHHEILLRDPSRVQRAYRIAAQSAHPDTGGSTEEFQRLQEAKRILDAHHGGGDA